MCGNSLRRWLRSVDSVYVPVQICRNFLSAFETRTTLGATHRSMTTEESVGYIMTVYDRYLRGAKQYGVCWESKKVLEVGPGDSLGVALCFVADGAEQVVCLDRFYSERDARQQAKIYSALCQAMTSQQRDRLFRVLSQRGGQGLVPNTVEYVWGAGIEEASRVLESNTFDVIVSNAVLEHVHNLEAAIAEMRRVLKPGGLVVHEVDLRNHGWFAWKGPLYFLTIHEALWRAMTSQIGGPNRARFRDYERLLGVHGFSDRVYLEIDRAFSRTDVQAVYSSSASQRDGATREDLRVSRFLFAGRLRSHA